MELSRTAHTIVAARRAAGHAEVTVYMALHYVRETESVNTAYERLNGLKEKGVPRWLIVRWAADANLIDPTVPT